MMPSITISTYSCSLHLFSKFRYLCLWTWDATASSMSDHEWFVETLACACV